MMKATPNHFNWPRRDDVWWVPVNHVLCLIDTVSSQSAGAPGYCLSEKMFYNILKLLEKFSVLMFYFADCFLL